MTKTQWLAVAVCLVGLVLTVVTPPGWLRRRRDLDAAHRVSCGLGLSLVFAGFGLLVGQG